MKKIVIVLGGNALMKKGQKPTIESQLKSTRKAIEGLFPLIKKNKAVLTHGNGPAVGYLLLQNEMTKSRVPSMPLDVLDAETEGQIGYLIQQNIQNLFRKNRIKRGVVTVLTQVLVSGRDMAFQKPQKFIGPFYSEKEAKKLGKKFTLKKDSDRGYRRVVPSPTPIDIIESEEIKKIIGNNAVAIAAGGGGIPVVKKRGRLVGIEAVVDKDLASSCLAKSINAKTLVMITDIDRAYLNFGKSNRKPIDRSSLKEIKEYYDEGHFSPGSMGPKIQAAIDFLEKGGEKVIITDIPGIAKSFHGKGGTVIQRKYKKPFDYA